MSRWIRFIIMLGVGFGVGLLYGWVLDPVDYVDTLPESMGVDYKTDYVLMVAEEFQFKRDVSLSIQHLSFLGGGPPETIIQEALFFAVQSGYRPADLGLLRDLSDALGGGQTPEVQSQP